MTKENTTPQTTEVKGEIVKETPVTEGLVGAGTPPPDKPELEVDPLLSQILSSRRAHETVGDQQFRTWLISYLRTLGQTVKSDKPGNIWVIVDEKSDTLFSCHIDTCHGTAESNKAERQDLAYDPTFGHLFLANPKTSGCLGADDGAGIFLMLKMIAAKVPGSYIFHVGEERGGIGSRAFVENKENKDFITSFSRAIAFDRAGFNEVIYVQGGRECASLEATKKLCDELNKFPFAEVNNEDQDPKYAPSTRGTFTDTKVYAGLVNECWNIAVGYKHQHSPSETLYLEHLYVLQAAVLTIDWDGLPVFRKPVEETYQSYRGKSYNKGYNNPFPKSVPPKGTPRFEQEDLLDDGLGGYMGYSREGREMSAYYASLHDDGNKQVPKGLVPISPISHYSECLSMTQEELVDAAEADPTVFAGFFLRMKARIAGLEAELGILTDALEQ